MPEATSTLISITVNGSAHETSATDLAALIDELDYKGVRIATARNGTFVAAGARRATAVEPGDRIEIVSARQGG